MKKVLFITYYWPPSGKASLHWPLKMIKFLPEFGWQPSVLTVKDESFANKDETLLNDVDKNLKVYSTRANEPFALYKKFIGKSKDEQLVASETISRTNKSLTHRISIWIRMNLFIPDARALWYFPGVSGGFKFLREEKVDAIVSVGPPHTAHLIGMRLSKKFRIPHFPVFTDPWVNIAYYKDFKRSKATLAIDNHFEKRVLKNSAAAIFVTKTTKEDYLQKYKFLKDKSYVLYWGFNEEDFKSLPPNPLPMEGEALSSEVILHAGNIFDFQNIPKFWERVKKEIQNGRKLKLKFIGTVSPGIKLAIEKAGLTPYTDYAGFLPYPKMIEELSKASYLLVCAMEKRHLPGKLFEYLRAGKPIIAFGDDNEEVKNILEETNAGMIFRYDEDGREFFDNPNRFHTDLDKVKLYDRRNIANLLSEILNNKISNK